MARKDRFFGHWTLTVSGRGSRVRLLLSGTAEVDGVYLPSDQPFVLEAAGANWQMSGERLPRDSDQWESLKPTTASAWDPQVGLTRQFRWDYAFSTGADPGFTPLVSRSQIIVNCWSNDSDLSAVPTPDPPEFTVPKKTNR